MSGEAFEVFEGVSASLHARMRAGSKCHPQRSQTRHLVPSTNRSNRRDRIDATNSAAAFVGASFSGRRARAAVGCSASGDRGGFLCGENASTFDGPCQAECSRGNIVHVEKASVSMVVAPGGYTRNV